MIQSTKQAAFPSRPSDSIVRRRTNTLVAAKRTEFPLALSPVEKSRKWLEDTFCLLLLLAMTVMVVAASTIMAREFIEQLFQYEGFGLMRRFGGM